MNVTPSQVMMLSMRRLAVHAPPTVPSAAGTTTSTRTAGRPHMPPRHATAASAKASIAAWSVDHAGSGHAAGAVRVVVNKLFAVI